MSSKLDTITSRMSKLMLKRWSMLAEVCREDGCSTPLMRDPTTSNTKCVWHDARELFPEDVLEETDSVVQPTALPKEDEKLDTVKAGVLEDKAGELRQRRREQGDLASERIGQRLLQGWAMIDKSCPNDACYNVPLVQDREKVQECVVCGQKYMDEDAYVAKYGSLKQDNGPELQQQPQSQPKQSQQQRQVAPAKEKCAVEAPVAPAQVLNTAMAAAPPCQLSPAITEAVNALGAKIVDLSARLTAATDLDDIQRISKAISSCAKAIAACKKAGTA
ncbi:hypothetical protein GGF43_003872 [Coemansia sp. RSA 2618]|nr:hypothetical protein GGF43_003872 [Coemansia sp. RSA 2618]